MKILIGAYATLLTKHGGLQQQIKSTKKCLENMGHQVFLFHEIVDTDEREFDIYHHFSLVPESISIFRFGKKHAVKTVLSPVFNYSASKYTKFGIKMLNSLMPFSVLGYKERLEMWNQADAIIFLGDNEKSGCYNFLGAPLAKNETNIGNGFNSLYKGILPNVITSEPYFIHVGTVYRHKQQHISIKLAHQLKLKLKIVGPISDEGYYNELITLIKELNIERFVEFLGYIDNTSDDYLFLLAEAKFSFLPSISEVYPISVLECLSLNVPVILTKNISAYKELVGEGLYTFDFSTEACLSTVVSIIDELRVPEETFLSVNLNYSWESISNKIIEVYRAKT